MEKELLDRLKDCYAELTDLGKNKKAMERPFINAVKDLIERAEQKIAGGTSRQLEQHVSPPAQCVNATLLIDSIVNLLNEDGHCYGSRPCATCKAITGIIGRPFGCYEYQRKRNMQQAG